MAVSDPSPFMRRRIVVILAALGFSVGAAAAGEPAGWWRQLDMHDLKGAPLTFSNRWVVVVFLSPECPIANSYLPKLNGLAAEFGPKGFAFVGDYSDQATDLAVFRDQVRDYGISFLTADDRAQKLVRYASASYTPEVFVFTNDGKTLYHGRIDDRVTGIGSARLKASNENLRDVLTELVAGKPGPFPDIPGFGCAISRPVPSH
jgi:thiol-disulfide isomerase/thioredoxin